MDEVTKKLLEQAKQNPYIDIPEYLRQLEKLEPHVREALHKGDWNTGLGWWQEMVIQKLDEPQRIYKFYETATNPIPEGYKRVMVYYDKYGWGRRVHQEDGMLAAELLCLRNYNSAKSRGEL